MHAGLMSTMWIPASFILAIATYWQAHAEEARIDTEFVEQREDGSIVIAVNCNLQGLRDPRYEWKYDECHVLSTSDPSGVSSATLATSGSWVHESNVKDCRHQVRLVNTKKERRDVQVAASSVIPAKIGQRLFCERNFRYCVRWGGKNGRTACTQDDPRIHTSVTLDVGTLVSNYTRRARITHQTNGSSLEAKYKSQAVLTCTVDNLPPQGNHELCRWHFTPAINNPNEAVIQLYTIESLQDQFPGTQRAVMTEYYGGKYCDLWLREIDETMEGHWSCHPSKGQDGFISPSKPISLIVTDAYWQAHAQEARIDTEFVEQREDGSIVIAVNCNLQGLQAPRFVPKYDECHVLSTSDQSGVSSAILTTSGSRVHESNVRDCRHQVRLVNTVEERRDVQVAALSVIPEASIGQRLFCQRNFRYCVRWGGYNSWTCTQDKPRNRTSGTLDVGTLVSNYTRRARIEEQTNGASLEVRYKSQAALTCRVDNLPPQGDHKLCRWHFTPAVNNANEAVIQLYTRESLQAHFPGTQPAVMTEYYTWKYCDLWWSEIDVTMEGNWSCHPSKGQDGFISPSKPISLIVTDECTTHSECKEEKHACLNATSEIPRRTCGDPCSTEAGLSICGNMKNAECKVDRRAPLGMRCSCVSGFGSDTGYPGNRTRCLRVCNKQDECKNNGEICHIVRNESDFRRSSRCLSLCEVEIPRCGQGSVCKIVKNATNYRWARNCECEPGKFHTELKPGSDHECSSPFFDGLTLTVDGERQEHCSVSQLNGSATCNLIVLEGTPLNVTCHAQQVFPKASLSFKFIKYRQSDRLLENIADNPSNILGDNHHSTLPQLNASSLDHNGTWVCKLKSEAFAASIRMKLIVMLPLDESTSDALGSPVAVGGGVAAAAMVIIIVAAIIVAAMRLRSKSQHKPENAPAAEALSLSTRNNEPRGPQLQTPSKMPRNRQNRPTYLNPTYDTLPCGPPTPAQHSPNPSIRRPPTPAMIATAMGQTGPPPPLPPKVESNSAQSQDDLIYADLDFTRAEAISVEKPPRKMNQGKQVKRKVKEDEEDTIYATIVGEIDDGYDLEPGDD